MIASELKTRIPQEKQPTFPALYQHHDGSVYFFNDPKNGICFKVGNHIDFIGRELHLGNHEVDKSVNWKRLGVNEEIVLKNTD